jgi:hypothetical protein
LVLPASTAPASRGNARRPGRPLRIVVIMKTWAELKTMKTLRKKGWENDPDGDDR